MNTILKYRQENALNKRQFCERFNMREQHYNHHFRDAREWAIIETEITDKLVEIKGEYIK